jgi:hypothetical protein
MIEPIRDRAPAGICDSVPPHMDDLAAGSQRFACHCGPPHAQEPSQHLRCNVVSDQRSFSDATRSGVRQKFEYASMVAAKKNRIQLSAPR